MTVREVAGAGQRLPDRRARRAAVRAHARARAAAVRPPPRRRRRRRARALAAPTSPASSPRLRIFNPDGSEAELSGNGAREAILYLRRARLDRRATRSRSRPRRARSARRSPASAPAASTWAARDRSATSTGEIGAGRMALPARLDRQPAVRDPRRRPRRARGARPRRARPADRAPRRASPTARTSRSGPSSRPTAIRARIFERGVGETLSSGTGACGAAVAHVLRGGDSPVTVRARRRRARGRRRRGPARRPHRLGGPGVPGELSSELWPAPMSAGRGAAGLATVDTPTGGCSTCCYPEPRLGAADGPPGRRPPATSQREDDARAACSEVEVGHRASTTSTRRPPTPHDAYLRLHLLSHRLVKPHGAQPRRHLRRAAERRLDEPRPGRPGRRCPRCACASARAGEPLVRLRRRQVPAHDRLRRRRPACAIADADRVRLGAHLAEGTTVMHEGFVNFNAGTLGASMVEGRISAGVVVGDGSDIGGGASIMGTLSGGGTRGHLDRRALPARRQRRASASRSATTASSRPGSTSPPARASRCPTARSSRRASCRGADGLLFRRNSQTGAVEALPRSGSLGRPQRGAARQRLTRAARAARSHSRERRHEREPQEALARRRRRTSRARRRRPRSSSRAASASASAPASSQRKNVASPPAWRRPGGLERGQQRRRAWRGSASRTSLDVRLVAPGGDRGALDELRRRDADVRPVALERGDRSPGRRRRSRSGSRASTSAWTAC